MGSTGSNGKVTPSIALALLQSLQAADTPEERLKDEDVQQSLPRRLGLSTVVTAQIRRYAELDRERDYLPAREIIELFQLVSRRPDAAAVFASTGRRLAERDHRRRSRGMRWLGRRLPQPLRKLLCFRSVHRIAKQLAPPGGARLEGKPPALVMRGGLLAQACGSECGCELLNAAFAQSIAMYRAGGDAVQHSRCESRGDATCVWQPAKA